MWVKFRQELENSYFARWRCYKDDSLSPEKKIKEIYLTPEDHPSFGGNVEAIIRFVNVEEADLFFKQFIFLYPSYLDVGVELHQALISPATICYKSDNEKGLIYDVVFSLIQKTVDLDKLCDFLNEQGVSSDILSTITSNARLLTDLEKNFYEKLLALNKDNFFELLKMAKDIVAANYKASALWELALACRASKEAFIEEWFEVLHCIPEDNNYYNQAQGLLAYDVLSRFDEVKDDDIVNKQQLFKEGIKHIIGSGGEMGVTELTMKMVCSFLGHPWQDKEQIFPVRAADASDIELIDRIVDLLTYAKQLRSTNESLQSQQVIFSLFGAASGASSSESATEVSNNNKRSYDEVEKTEEEETCCSTSSKKLRLNK